LKTKPALVTGIPMTAILSSVFFASSLLAMAMPRAAALRADQSDQIRKARTQFEAGDYTAATMTLQSVISQEPGSAEGHYWLARTYYETRDSDNATAQLEKAVALDGKNSVYHQWLGRAYGAQADRERSFTIARKVKKEFEEAVRLEPSNIPARRDLEEFCLDAPWIVGGSKDEARAQVDAIATIDPIQGHLARAVFNKNQGKTDLEESEYRQVLNAKASHIEPYFEVADFFAAQNKPADMQTAIQAAAAVSPNDVRLGYYRGVLGVLSGGAAGSQAEQYLKAYIASTPNRSDWPAHAEARDWLGRLYEAQGKRSEAAEQYRAALQLDPSRKETRARLDKLSH
jgi:tetratricopeptide (TPR) repeat protein